MTEATKHLTARLQMLEYLMTQNNLSDLLRHTDVLLLVMYAQNAAEEMNMLYNQLFDALNLHFYVSFPFVDWLDKIQSWKAKLSHPAYRLEHDVPIGESRAIRMRNLIEKLSDRNAVLDAHAKLEHPYDGIAKKTCHEVIVDLATALESLRKSLIDLSTLPLRTTKEVRRKALRSYLDAAVKKESVQTELQEYIFFCNSKRNVSFIKQLLYLRQRIEALVGKDELICLNLSESERCELLCDLKYIFEENEINPAPEHIPDNAAPWANDELFAKVLCFVNLNAGQCFPVLDEDSIVEYLVRKDVSFSDEKSEHLQILFILMEAMCKHLDETLQTRFDNTTQLSIDILRRFNYVLQMVGQYNARLLPCMANGKTPADLNNLFARWFSSKMDIALQEPQLALFRLLEDGHDKIKMETYVHLLREASDLGFFKKEKPVSDKLYNALSRVQNSKEDAFPISGPSFNKYFRNPDFCNEEKWLERTSSMGRAKIMRKTIVFRVKSFVDFKKCCTFVSLKWSLC